MIFSEASSKYLIDISIIRSNMFALDASTQPRLWILESVRTGCHYIATMYYYHHHHHSPTIHALLFLVIFRWPGWYTIHTPHTTH